MWLYRIRIFLTRYNVFTNELQDLGHATRIKDFHELQERIVDKWDKLDQRIIDKVVGEWWKRLWACVVTGGGQFEHKMWTFLVADILSCDILEG